MSEPKNGFEAKRAEADVVRIKAALTNAVKDFQSVKANVDNLLGDIYQKFPQLKPEPHPRLVELTTLYDSLLAKVKNARGDIVQHAMHAIAAGVVEHHTTSGTDYREDPLFQRITDDLYQANIIKRATTRAEIDKWIKFVRDDLQF